MSEPAPSALDWAGIAALATLVIGAIGGAVKWFFGRADSREQRQQKREDDYVAKIEDRLVALEKLTNELWTCFNLVTHELHAKDPANPALRRAADILGDSFPIDLTP